MTVIGMKSVCSKGYTLKHYRKIIQRTKEENGVSLGEGFEISLPRKISCLG